jgi:hypothetical protein
MIIEEEEKELEKSDMLQIVFGNPLATRIETITSSKRDFLRNGALSTSGCPELTTAIDTILGSLSYLYRAIESITASQKVVSRLKPKPSETSALSKGRSTIYHAHTIRRLKSMAVGVLSDLREVKESVKGNRAKAVLEVEETVLEGCIKGMEKGVYSYLSHDQLLTALSPVLESEKSKLCLNQEYTFVPGDRGIILDLTYVKTNATENTAKSGTKRKATEP